MSTTKCIIYNICSTYFSICNLCNLYLRNEVSNSKNVVFIYHFVFFFELISLFFFLYLSNLMFQMLCFLFNVLSVLVNFVNFFFHLFDVLPTATMRLTIYLGAILVFLLNDIQGLTLSFVSNFSRIFRGLRVWHKRRSFSN